MGDKTAKLTVLPSRTVYLCGQPMANISDHKSMVNLAPFGRCRSLGYPATASATAAHHGVLTPMPCVHNTPMPWMPGKIDYFIKGKPALLKTCKCTCMWGGIISLLTDGQVGEGTQWVQKKSEEEFDNGKQIADNISFRNRDALVDARPMGERKSLTQTLNEARANEERIKRRNIESFLSETKSGGIVWDNERFKQLDCENADYLGTQEGIIRLNAAKEAFQRVRPTLKSITYNQLYQIVGRTLGLKESQVDFKKKYEKEEGLLGWHPHNSKIAILNEREENNMSMCQKIAVYAHESTHVVQDIIIKNARMKQTQTQTPYERKLVFAAETYTDSNVDYEKYSHNFKEVDARRFEIVFGKACVDYYNQTKNLTQ